MHYALSPDLFYELHKEAPMHFKVNYAAEVNYGLENNATVNYAHVHLSFVRFEAIFEPPTHYVNYAPEVNCGL